MELESIPPEILNYIAQYLDLKSLLNFTKVSRTLWYTCSQTSAYQDIFTQRALFSEVPTTVTNYDGDTYRNNFREKSHLHVPV
jgi:hypothetical protein